MTNTFPVHLEGMGVVGCLIADALHQQGIPFTWHDDQSHFTAWRASTGCIFPARGHDEDMAWWQDYYLHGGPDSTLWRNMEPAQWCYLSKNPPHGAKRIRSKLVGERLRASDAISLHVNVQRFVSQTRARFMSTRVEAAPVGFSGTYIVTHGFGGQASHYVWGWSARVPLRFLAPWQPWTHVMRVCLYLRDGMVGDYLYPVPGEDAYYAGTSRIAQKVPYEMGDLQDRFDKWHRRVVAAIGDVVEVPTLDAELHMIQGWRPKDRTVDVYLESRGPRYIVRAMGGGGFRHWPRLRGALEAAGILKTPVGVLNA